MNLINFLVNFASILSSSPIFIKLVVVFIFFVVFVLVLFVILQLFLVKKQRFFSVIFNTKTLLALLMLGMSVILLFFSSHISDSYHPLLNDVALFIALLALFFVYSSVVHLFTYKLGNFFKQQRQIELPYRRVSFTLNLTGAMLLGLFFIFEAHELSGNTGIIESLAGRLVAFILIILVFTLLALVLGRYTSALYNFYLPLMPSRALLIRHLVWPVRLSLLAVLSLVGLHLVGITGQLSIIITHSVFVFFMVALAWFLWCMVDILGQKMVQIAQKDSINSDPLLLNLAITLLKISLVFVSFLLIVQHITGQQLKGIFAALGIGGMAIALASQDLLKNLLAGITLILDKPFKIGDTISTLGYTGVIKQIGLRSTLITSADGSQIVLPNSSVAASPVQNNSFCKGVSRSFLLHFSNDTPLNTLEEAIAIINALLAKEQNNLVGSLPFMVTLANFDKGLFIIKVSYSYKYSLNTAKGDLFAHEINLKIVEAFNKAGIKPVLMPCLPLP
jgi:MscS family membrane protein